MCSVKPSLFWHGGPFNPKHALQRISQDVETESSSSSESDASLSPTRNTTHNIHVEGGERDKDRISEDKLIASLGQQNNDFKNSFSQEMKKVWEEDHKDEACLASMEQQLANKEQNLVCTIANSAGLHSQICVAEQGNKIEELQNNLTKALQRASSAEEEVQRYDREIRRLRDHLRCIQDEGYRIDNELKARVVLLQKEKEGAIEESRVLLDQLSQKDQEVVAKEEEISILKAALANIDKCQESHKKDLALLQSEQEINFQSQLKENNSLQAAKCALEMQIEVASLREKSRVLEEERNSLLTQLQKGSEAQVTAQNNPSEKVFCELLDHVKKLSLLADRAESPVDNDGPVKLLNRNTKAKHEFSFCDQSVQTNSEKSSCEMPLQDNEWKSMQESMNCTRTSLTSVELGHHSNATTFECVEQRTSKKAHGHRKCTTGYAVNTCQQKKLSTKTEVRHIGNFHHSSFADTDFQGLQNSLQQGFNEIQGALLQILMHHNQVVEEEKGKTIGDNHKHDWKMSKLYHEENTAMANQGEPMKIYHKRTLIPQGVVRKRDTNKVSEGKANHEQSTLAVWKVCNNLVNALGEAYNELLLLSGESSFLVPEMMGKSEITRIGSYRPSRGETHPEAEALAHPQKATLCNERGQGNLDLPNRKKQDCFGPRNTKKDVKEQAHSVVIAKKQNDQAASPTTIQCTPPQSSQSNGLENKDVGNKNKGKCYVAKKPAWM